MISTRISVPVLIILLCLCTVGPVFPQQELTFTVTAANANGIMASIDLPGLTGNPLAIIVATPLGNTRLLNTHPLQAWYYSGKWFLANSDGERLPVGSKYQVQFYLEPGPDHFLHVFTKENIGAEGSYIDHPLLNGNPGAQIKILQNHAPEIRSYNLNRNEAQALYSTAAKRWYITNINGQPLYAKTAYNIVITSGRIAAATPEPTPSNPLTKPVDPVVFGTLPRSIDGVKTPAKTPATTPTPTPLTSGGLDPGKVIAKTQFRDWQLRPDRLPTIAPDSDIILFIHGMDSRAEEAEDITKAIFALKRGATAPSASSAPPVASGPDPGAVAGLQQILQKYEACVLERYETVIDMINRGLNPQLSGLATTVGLTDRDQIQCLAGNTCSRSFRQTTFAALKAQAALGDSSNFEARLKTIIPSDCFDCSKHQERHTKHVHCTMECGGNSGIDLIHPERNFGPCFETCKAGVDITRLATETINAIHLAVTQLSAGVRPANIPPGTIASNYSTVQFNSCPNPMEGCPETCDFPDNFSQGARKAVLPSEYYEPLMPRELLDTTPPAGSIFNIPAARNIGSNEGRLNDSLRSAASDPRPLYSLGLAALEFAKGNSVLATAYADLSVTGRRAFDDFKTNGGPKEAFCQGLNSKRPPAISEVALMEGCGKALDRAYRVANFLRTGQIGETTADKAKKTAERQALSWIAVSGEDDQPHRPVNVPSSDHPQYDTDVFVHAPSSQIAHTVKVHARYTIAESKAVDPAGGGRNLVIISLDLPTSGYTQNLDYEAVSPLSDIGDVTWAPVPDFKATGKTPVLDFIEEFIVSFVETIDQPQMPVKSRIKAVMGGSLGGNMTFRLGRRPDTVWLPKFIVWSPASIWYSLGEGPDPLKHFGPRSAYEGADAARKNPRLGDRAVFFGSWDKPVLPLVIPMAQSDTWTSEYYPCKRSAIASARLDRQETYDANFLAWHWRLGGEQLLYSHQTVDPATHKPRYMSNVKPMLLACGIEDTVAFNDICPATQNTAPQMIATPGKALFLSKTGHSLDNERRMYWARQVMDFLGL